MLEVRNLHSFYGDAHILSGLDIDVPDGRVVAVLGRNGMGKTTLIRSIMGLRSVRVREGSIRYEGQELRGLPPHVIAQKRIGFVPQGRRLFSSVTVSEHLSMLPHDRRSTWTPERVFEVFPRLAERRNHLGSQLSGGERQMLAVARALTLGPKLLLMDEPSEGLAPVMVQHLETIVTQLKETGISILLVEQNLFSALAVASEVYILETGRVVYRGSPAELRGDHESMRKFLGVA
ncbi:MAG: ABC transporter ATP-binding protein [Variibacter sp.]|nr:ABC transporter ATP-binding protein [Variibacter sp.]